MTGSTGGSGGECGVSLRVRAADRAPVTGGVPLPVRALCRPVVSRRLLQRFAPEALRVSGFLSCSVSGGTKEKSDIQRTLRITGKFTKKWRRQDKRQEALGNWQ